MVEKVADFRQKNPAICTPLVDAIEAITLDAMKHLDEPAYLGRLMDMNHSLLEAIGVGHPQLSRLVLACRATGAFGAKITGAGGGGCMVALAPKNLRARIAGAIEVFDGRAIITCMDTEGLRKEKDA
jgi:mevalonate kinase